MNNMRRIGLTLVLATLMTAAFGAAQPGKDYVPVNPPQPTDAGSKVEVLEFFSYACPHCNHLEPSMETWVRKQPANVSVRRVPVTFGRTEWVALARLYYTLETMGEVDRLNGKVFHAIHDLHQNLTTQEACVAWAASQGLDGKKFADIFTSFGVESKLQRGNAKAQNYAIDGVPTLIVGGRFSTSPAKAGGNEQALAVADELIAGLKR